MKVEVEVISNEIIKPSSPTPAHLRHYQLSFLDQTSPKTYNPLVFFYELNGDHNITEISNKIKKSLSEVLTLFYPLAGRVKDDRYVDCNDEGILYSVARVNSSCQLSDAINNSNLSDLNKFLPFKLYEFTEFAVGVQLNVFEGGGIAVGLCILHQIADALSCIMFVKTWVAISRGEADHIAHPEFVSATLFPPMDDPAFDANANILPTVVTKRFVFDASAIEAIRSKYKEEMTKLNDQKPLSRVETLSGFLWGHLVGATSDENSDESKKVYGAIHAVNLRHKLDPKLPEHSFGNLSRCSVAMLSAEEHCSFEVLIRKIREGIRNVDMDYIRKVQQEGDLNLRFVREYARNLIMNGGKYISFLFTSLCRFPLYEADFGYGEPVWVSSASLCFNNLVVFLDTKTGDGIEAYIALKEEQMAKLEANQDFLKAVSPVV